ncbi:hypothetical protein ACFVWY_22200, partial [Streptomyces sp. NPDC058195]
VFHTVSKPVTRAIDKIINLITKKGKALWNKLKEKNGDKRNPGTDERRGEQKKPEEVRKTVRAALKKSLPVGTEVDAVGPKLDLIYKRHRNIGLHGLRLVPEADRLGFGVMVSASPESEEHHSKAKEEDEQNAFEKFLELNPRAKEIYDAYERARAEALRTTQIDVANLRMKSRKNSDGTYSVHGQSTPTTATGILTIGGSREFKLGEFPSRPAKSSEKNGENHSEPQLLKSVFSNWKSYTKTHSTEEVNNAHLELNVTRTPCPEFCTPKIIDARKGKDWAGKNDLPQGWDLNITVNAMSVYRGAREKKTGEVYGGRKTSIQALVDLVKAGIKIGMWTPGSESLITAWAVKELEMYPEDGSVMSPPTRHELREANVKMYKVLKQLVYTPGAIGQATYDSMLVEVSGENGQKKKIIKIPFAR